MKAQDPFSMSMFEAEIKLHSKLVDMARDIEVEFEDNGLSKKCKFQKIWVDPFDGERIRKCYKVGKGIPREDRMECVIENCPLGKL